MQQDPRIMRRLAELEQRLDDVARMATVEYMPPLHFEGTASQGGTLSIDQGLLDAQPADDSGEPPSNPEVVKIITGVNENGVYDGTIQPRVGGAFEDFYDPPESIWVVDVSDSEALTADDLYCAIVVRDPNDDPVQEAAGRYLLSTIDDNQGNPLTGPDWSLILTLTPSPWSAGDYDYGSYVSHDDHNYVCVNEAGTSETPGASADWLQADVLNAPQAYSGGATYTYDPLAGADVVQEVRLLYAIRTAPNILDRTGTLGLTLGAITFSASGAISPDRTGTLGILLKPITLSAVGARSLPRTGTLGLLLKPITFSAVGTISNRRRGTLGLMLKPITFGAYGAIAHTRTGTLGILLNPITFGAFGAIAHARTGKLGLLLKSIEFAASGVVASSGGGGGPGACCEFRAKLTNVGVNTFGPESVPVYAWAEQTPDGYGNLIDLPGGRSGTATSGPWMRELNDNFTTYPTFVYVSFRGFDKAGVKIYDFESCCVGVAMDSIPPPARTGVLGITLGSIEFSAAGTFTGPVSAITRVPLGEAGSASSTSISVGPFAFLTSGLLVISYVVGDTPAPTFITYTDGSGPHTPGLAVSRGMSGAVDFYGENYEVNTVFLAVPAGTGTITLANADATVLMLSAELIHGLASNLQYNQSSAFGGSSPPDSGSFTTGFVASQYVAGAILMATPPGSIVWQNGFTTSGQDVTVTDGGGNVLRLSTGYKTVSSFQSVDAALNAAAHEWAACVSSFY